MPRRMSVPNKDQLTLISPDMVADDAASAYNDERARGVDERNLKSIGYGSADDALATQASNKAEVFGPSVDVAERAVLLQAALIALGKHNQRIGFDTASNFAPHKQSIEHSYGAALPDVQKGALKNTGKFATEAAQNFWKATGWSALRGTDMLTNEQIDASGRTEWRAFKKQYADTDKRPARDNFKKSLKRSETAARRIRTKQAKEEASVPLRGTGSLADQAKSAQKAMKK